MAWSGKGRQKGKIAAIGFCLLLEALVLLSIRFHDADAINWARWTAEKVLAGQPVQPHFDGPYDFRMFWSVGRMERAGHAADTYKLQSLNAFEARHRTNSTPWINTPIALLAAGFAGIAAFLPAVALWTLAVTLGGILALRLSRIPWLVIASALISPAFIYNASVGQINFLPDAFFIASLAVLEETPAQAGLMMGLVAFKPQAGLLGPVVFLARRAYRSFAIAAITIVSLVLVTLLLFGPRVWISYLTYGLPLSHKIFVSLVPAYAPIWGESPFWVSRGLGLDIRTSYLIQILSTSLAVIWCWQAWRDDQAERLPRIALTACLALLATPYYFMSDTCAFSIGVALLAWHRGRIRPADMLLWAWPALRWDWAEISHVDPTPVVILIAAIRAHRMLHQPGRQSGSTEKPMTETALPQSPAVS